MKEWSFRGIIISRVVLAFAVALALTGREMLIAEINGGRESAAIDPSGSWVMKDFTRGIRVTKQFYLPGNRPKDCLTDANGVAISQVKRV